MSQLDAHQTQKYDLLDWVKDARKGKTYVYYTGFLCRDAEKVKDGRVKLIATRSLVWDMYKKGYILLVQRKLGPMSYEYIAVRTARKFQ